MPLLVRFSKLPKTLLLAAVLPLVLSGCQESKAQASVRSNTPSAASTSGAADIRLGFYTGRFDLTAAQAAANKAYQKWYDKQPSDARPNDYAMLDVPVSLRKNLYEHPLYGYVDNKGVQRSMVYSIPATSVSMHLDEFGADNTVSARMVTLGKEWAVSGTWSSKANGYSLTLKPSNAGTPSGTWQIEMNAQTKEMSGTWSKEQSTQHFNLVAYDFNYNPKLSLDGGYGSDENPNAPHIFQPDPSLVRYTQANCHSNGETDGSAGLTRAEIRYLRNLIFARHGKAFSTLEVRSQFESESLFDEGWYVPVHQEINQNELTDIEKNNLNIMQKCEPNAPTELKTYWG